MRLSEMVLHNLGQLQPTLKDSKNSLTGTLEVPEVLPKHSVAVWRLFQLIRARSTTGDFFASVCSNRPFYEFPAFVMRVEAFGIPSQLLPS